MLTIGDAIDYIFSHNQIIGIWKDVNSQESELIWRGMAHEIPEKYLSETGWKIVGIIDAEPADMINIRLSNFKCDITGLEFRNELFKRLNNNATRYTGGKHNGISYLDIETFDVDEVYEICDRILDGIPEDDGSVD